MDEVRSRSRALFGGAQYRLEVAAAISAGDLVTIKDLAEQLGDPPGKGSVNTELKVLEAAGLLERLPRVGSDRRVFLRAKPSPYWDTCRALIEDALSAAASVDARQ
jgi:DNA-binding transcriptional regulator GbsR (MarR family)